MEKIFDLPAHPLFVHAPLVLAPLACLGAIAMALRPVWRATYRWHLVIATGVVLVAAQLAMGSGEELTEALEVDQLVEKHQGLAETTRIWLLLWFLTAAGAVAHRFWMARQGADSTNPVVTKGQLIQHALAALGVVAAIVATIWMFRTGHEGARIVWEGTV